MSRRVYLQKDELNLLWSVVLAWTEVAKGEELKKADRAFAILDRLQGMQAGLRDEEIVK